jgi:hypothetical protein
MVCGRSVQSRMAGGSSTKELLLFSESDHEHILVVENEGLETGPKVEGSKIGIGLYHKYTLTDTMFIHARKNSKSKEAKTLAGRRNWSLAVS